MMIFNAIRELNNEELFQYLREEIQTKGRQEEVFQKKKPTFNSSDYDNFSRMTTLQWALKLHKSETVLRELIDLGGRKLVTERDANGLTALHYACEKNSSIDLIFKLVQMGGWEIIKKENEPQDEQVVNDQEEDILGETDKLIHCSYSTFSDSDQSSTLSFDPSEFEEEEFESEYDTQNSIPTLTVIDPSDFYEEDFELDYNMEDSATRVMDMNPLLTKLPTIQENLVRSFSGDSGINFDGIFNGKGQTRIFQR